MFDWITNTLGFGDGGFGENLFKAFDATKMTFGLDDSFASQTANLLAENADPMLRYSKEFAQNQQMQNYLAPLQHERFVSDLFKSDGPGKALIATAAAPAYEGVKAFGQNAPPSFLQESAQRLVAGAGTGKALTSFASPEAVGRAMTGFAKGAKGAFGDPFDMLGLK